MGSTQSKFNYISKYHKTLRWARVSYPNVTYLKYNQQKPYQNTTRLFSEQEYPTQKLLILKHNQQKPVTRMGCPSLLVNMLLKQNNPWTTY